MMYLDRVMEASGRHLERKKMLLSSSLDVVA